MTKKLISLFVSICLLLSLTACVIKYNSDVEGTTATEILTEVITSESAETIGFGPSPEASVPDVEETFPPEDQEEVIDPTVYVTKSGEKYHRESCQWGDIPMLLSEAVAAGYTSCDKCF